jgi:hypothetical protein
MSTASEVLATSAQPMSDYEEFVFDLKGFLVIPSVLSAAEIDVVRAHMRTYRTAHDTMPEHHRAPMAGPAEFLIDHPRVMGILQAVIAPNPDHIRLESVFECSRSVDCTNDPWTPHVGGTNVLPCFSYRFHNGRIYSAMTRVVWELNAVIEGHGGTCLVPGSHKANMASAHDGNWPAEADDPDSGLWETYGCPAGSLVVFSEGVRHTGAAWTHPDHPRDAILLAYNHVSARHHEPKPCMSPAVINGLAEQRRRFFRDVWVMGNNR